MSTSRHRSASSSAPAIPSDLRDLEQVYAQYLDPIYRCLYARVGNRQDAEDLTSRVFLKAFRQLDLARVEKSILCWLFTVARTVLADHWRQEYRPGLWAELDELLIKDTDALGVWDDAEKILRVEEILGLLPGRYRALLEMRFLRGYTVEETARALGVTSGNVKVIQRRALCKAARLMEC